MSADDPKFGRDHLSSGRPVVAIRPYAFSRCLQMIDLCPSNFGISVAAPRTKT